MKYDLEIWQPEYGAGTTHNWDKDTYGIRGIGIASYRFNAKPSLKIKIGGDVYRVTTSRVKEFLIEYPKSIHITKGVKLLVIPIAIMDLLEEAPRIPTYVDPPVKNKQPKLF